MCADFVKYRYYTSETTKNWFDDCWINICEFSTLGFIQIVENLHVSYRGLLVMDQNWKIRYFVLGCAQYLHGNKLRAEKMSDKMNNNISIVPTISSLS